MSKIVLCPESENSSSNDGTYYYIFLGKEHYSIWKHIEIPLVILVLLICINIKLIKMFNDHIRKLKSPNT